MAESTRTIEIFASSAVATVATVTLLGSGTAGILGAKRILTHPDSANFNPLVYWGNPEITLGIDNEVLHRVNANLVRTEETTRVVRHPAFDSDVLITEKWPGGGKRLSMPSYFARQLHDIASVPPDITASDQQYITWQPRDKNAKTYNVVVVDFNIGGDDSGINFTERRGSEGGEILGALEGLDVSPTGAIVNEVVLKFKIVSEAA